MSRKPNRDRSGRVEYGKGWTLDDLKQQKEALAELRKLANPPNPLSNSPYALTGPPFMAGPLWNAMERQDPQPWAVYVEGRDSGLTYTIVDRPPQFNREFANIVDRPPQFNREFANKWGLANPGTPEPKPLPPGRFQNLDWP